MKRDLGGLNRQASALRQFVQTNVPQTSGNQNMTHYSTIVTWLHSQIGAPPPLRRRRRSPRPPRPASLSSTFKLLLEAQGARLRGAGGPAVVGPASSELRSRKHAGGTEGGDVVVDMGGVSEEQMQRLDQLERDKRAERDKVTRSIETTISELGGRSASECGCRRRLLTAAP